jgi:chemotaxis family two-component system sensor kinase Cph1
MTDTPPDVEACEREPIHIPGSIQPHGLMVVADPETLKVSHVAGDIEGRLGCHEWCGSDLKSVIGPLLADQAALVASGAHQSSLGRLTTPSAETLDVSAHLSGRHLVIELEPASDLATPMALVEEAAKGFERAVSLVAMCERAAIAFRRLTGFDRVMVYRFLDDEAGQVLAEDRRQDLPGFLNHHFPASDIPRQARALYVRNLTRVIPDVAYRPAPLRPVWTDPEPLDLSDSALRSVSPIHLQYLANMDVSASASISIVNDGTLWGLIACHNATPRGISYDVRVACRTLAGDMARQIRAKDEAEGYRERIRLTSFEGRIVSLLSREGSLDETLIRHLNDMRAMFGGDGVAVSRGGEIVVAGACPSESEVRSLAHWLLDRAGKPVFSSDRLSEVYPGAAALAAAGSGVLAITLSNDEPWILFWFRAEQIEVVNWAGNPHKSEELNDTKPLTPRSSFAAWEETVRGRSRRWTQPEIEAAGRLRAMVLDIQRYQRTEHLNRRLIETLREKEALLKQNEFLVGECNHRVQNSLMLVSSFLAMQARSSEDALLKGALEEARRRLAAVGLVHRRLYRSDEVQQVDAARYIEELCADMLESMGQPWGNQFVLDLAPVVFPTDRMVTLGLVLTELLINAQKYAYGGAPGRLEIQLVQHRIGFRLSVSDHGAGKTSVHKGFGSRMMDALVAQLGGKLTFSDNNPGLRATLTAPIETPRGQIPDAVGLRPEPPT